MENNVDIKKEEKYSYKFKMSEIFNFDTGKTESADYFLSQDEGTKFRLRTSLRNGKKRYGCPVCKSKVILKRSNRGNFYFSHIRLEEGQTCFLVDQSNSESKRIQEYNYHKESQEHIDLKNAIAYHLKNTKGVDKNSVKIEKVVKGQAVPKTWKKPDVQFVTDKGKRFAVEIQLSHTWLADIVKRDMFYEKEDISILWVFNDFEPYGNTKTTQGDIFYNNPAINVFVFNKAAALKSYETGDLHLDCYFKSPEKTGRDSYTIKWENRIFNIKDIRIRKRSKKPYFVDYFKLIEQADEWREEQRELIRIDREKKEQQRLIEVKKLEEIQKKKDYAKIKRVANERRNRLLNSIKNRNENLFNRENAILIVPIYHKKYVNVVSKLKKSGRFDLVERLENTRKTLQSLRHKNLLDLNKAIRTLEDTDEKDHGTLDFIIDKCLHMIEFDDEILNSAGNFNAIIDNMKREALDRLKIIDNELQKTKPNDIDIIISLVQQRQGIINDFNNLL